MTRFKNILCLALLSLIPHASVLADKLAPVPPTVNILAWWDYLNVQPALDKVSAQCGVHLSIDEYISNFDFIRRMHMHKHEYDILIFSDIVTPMVDINEGLDDVPDLSAHAAQYHPAGQRIYQIHRQPKNFAHFSYWLRAFMWDPDVIEIKPTDSIYEIIEKRENEEQLIVISTDPATVYTLFDRYHRASQAPDTDVPLISYAQYGEMIQTMRDRNIRFSGSASELFAQDDFALALLWSGAAFQTMQTLDKKFEVLFHPEFSHTAVEFLAALNSEAKTVCVANALLSPEVIALIQNEKYFLSPYATYHSIEDKAIREHYEKGLGDMTHTLWRYLPDEDMFWQIHGQWFKSRS